MKKLIATAMFLFLLVPVAGFAAEAWSGSGEVLDMGCYEKGQKGPGHASCAKRCLTRGSDMGLLTDDGTLVLIKKDGSDEGAYKALQNLGGEKAKVSGTVEKVGDDLVLTVKSGQPMG